MLDKISKQEKNIKEFMRGTSVEVTPGGARAIEDFSAVSYTHLTLPTT